MTTVGMCHYFGRNIRFRSTTDDSAGRQTNSKGKFEHAPTLHVAFVTSVGLRIHKFIVPSLFADRPRMSADPLIVDTTARMLTELCGSGVVTAAEDGTWPDPLWEALEESALTRAWIPEALGGPGTSIADGFAIVRLTGTHAVPAPLAETLLAGWLASEAGLDAPEGSPHRRARGCHFCASARRRRAGRLGEACPRSRASANTSSPCTRMAIPPTPAARTRAWALVRRSVCTVVPGTSFAGEPSDTVLFDGANPVRAVGAGGYESRRAAAADGSGDARRADGWRARALSRAVAPVRLGPAPVRPPDRKVPGGAAQPRGARGRGGGRRPHRPTPQYPPSPVTGSRTTALSSR